MKWIGKVTVGMLGLGTLAMGAASYVLYNMAIDRKDGPSEDMLPEFQWGKSFAPYRERLEEAQSWFLKEPFKEVEIQSEDYIRLHGYYLTCKEPKRTVICVHGYRGSGVKDFAYIARFYHNHQCNVLLVDQRGHGKSEGNHVDFGIMGRKDVRSWAKYLNSIQEPTLPMFLDGVSMGATTVLMAGGLKLPENVRGIVADCGFTSPWEMVKVAAGNTFHVPWFPLIYFVELQCRIRGGFSLKECSATEELKKCKLPILFVHGKDDHFVPVFMSQKNYDACASTDKKLELIDLAGHGLSYMVEEERCNEELLKFFGKYS